MTDEKKYEGPKTKNLSKGEFKQVVLDAQNKAIQLHNFPNNSSTVLKIVAKPTIKVYENDDGTTKEVVYFNTEWKYDEENRIPLILRVSKGAYERWNTKITEGKIEYLDKYAIFTKNLINNKVSHSVSIPVGEPKDFVSAIDMLNKIDGSENEPVPQVETVDVDKIKEFVGHFIEQVKLFNNKKEAEEKPEEKKELSLQFLLQKWTEKEGEMNELAKQTITDMFIALNTK